MKINFRDSRPAERRWPMKLALTFILATLVTLVAVPWLVQRRVTALRAEIVASEPARSLTLAWRFNLVREMSALSELLLTGDRAQRNTYSSSLQAEERIYEDLAPLAAQMGPVVVERFSTARTLAQEWHARVDDRELIRQRDQGIGLPDIPRERRLFEDALGAVAALDSAIIDHTARTRAQIGAAERDGLMWTLFLGLLTLLAAGVVFKLAARVENYAEEAEHRRAEAAAALDETARTAEARHRLMRGITHDVKNPLGAAKGYGELLSMEIKGPLTAEQKPLVEGMQRSIDSALAIITDLLELARVDGGMINVEREEIDLARISREAAADFSALARTAGHDLEARPEADPLIAHTDPMRVRQILDNLLSNAIKYTPAPGRITVTARKVETAGTGRRGAWATLEVSDTGPGIPPEHRDVVFDEFSRLHEKSPIKGQGLGLAIARNLARRLGGDLTIAENGPGATFVLWIPQRD